MKLKYYYLLLFSFLATTASAQSLDEARKMFTQGNFEKAKPVFQRYVKSQPNNANYNYWYGVCCLETGEVEESIRYLEVAHKRRIQNAPLKLGKAYNEVYRFDESVQMYEQYIANQQKKKQNVDDILPLLEKSKMNARMLKGVEEVSIIDSFVVDKQDFLEAYKISEESGNLYAYNEFFKTTGNNNRIVYETELKNKVYYGDIDEDQTLSIFTRNKMHDEWGKPYPLPASINSSGNTNYPFVLTDGITIYFASDGAESMGGYDIFVTRYNTGTEAYLNPENVGMPFNSPYNDYMYVIDEYNELGWFATDRYQPEDKVCIYVFIPNSSKRTYNYEAMEPVQIRSLAKLNSIEDTWKDEEAVEAAKKKLEAVINAKPNEEKIYDFLFVINDDLTYRSFNDFKSPVAKQLFGSYQQLVKDYSQLKDKLKSQREWFSTASETERNNASAAIVDLEKRVLEMSKEVDQLEIKIRNEEIQTFKK